LIPLVRASFGGDSYRVFFLGSLGSFAHGTLPDYLHRPYIFRRGQLSRFLLWVPWEVFHMVVCLIIYIVRTSFGGDSYRLVLFLGSLGSFPHGTLPDYLHRPYIFRRGQLPRFFFWVSWEVYVLINIFNIPLF
jgi:hypothetical protein